ncbi:MAG: hypothetical protein WAK50_14330 [Nitrososphaeraceae archaeon]|jgi:hypothetical protein
MAPRQVIVKVMTVNKPANHVFDFFSDVKNMETGGALKSATTGDGDWWQFEHNVAGKGRMKVIQVRVRNIRS